MLMTRSPSGATLDQLLGALTPAEGRELDALLAPPLRFRDFVARVAPHYRHRPHCVYLMDVLQRVADGDLTRLMVVLPPRHGKSETISRLFPAYLLYRQPRGWVALSSYGAHLAELHARHARDYYLAAAGTLSRDARAVQLWETGHGGGMWASGVGGAATGKGYSLCGIVDDPLKDAEEAQSLLVRDRHRDWWRSVWDARRDVDTAPQIIAMTRWDPDDLMGWQLFEEQATPQGWTIVDLPVIAGAADPLKAPQTCTVLPDYRAVGEVLCAEVKSLADARDTIAKAGMYWGPTVWLGRPRPREGAIFKRAWFEIVDVPPARGLDARAWDKAATDGDGNWTVGVKMRRVGGMYYVLDVCRGQWGPGDRDAIVRQTAMLDGTEVRVRGPQDPGAAGKTDAAAFARLLSGFSVRSVPVSGSKLLRADPLAAQAQAGNVKLVRGDWNAGFLDELCNFLGRGDEQDDQVDAAADAFTELAALSVPEAAPLSLTRPSAWRGR